MEIREEIPSLEVLAEYSTIPISFHGQSRLHPVRNRDVWTLTEVTVTEFFKDYDTLEHPAQWYEHFDMSRWVIFSAFESEERIGGLVLAIETPGVDMLENRRGLAVIWDIRIATESRRKNIGSQLVRRALEWSKEHGYSEIKVETQNVNVAACRFYDKMGFKLRTVRPRQYAGLPDEIQFLWYREL